MAMDMGMGSFSMDKNDAMQATSYDGYRICDI